MATAPAAIFPISIGIKNGDTLSGPLSLNFPSSVQNVLIPPIPEPTYTPNLVLSISDSRILLSSTAWQAAAMAYCINKSDLLISATES